MSILSCNKKDSLDTGGSNSEEEEQKVWGYNYLISNSNIMQDASFKCLYPKYNDQNAPLYERDVPQVDPSPLKWVIEYFDDGSVRFWLQNIGWLEKQRVMDIDCKNLKSDDGLTEAVMRMPTSDFSQTWDLIGAKDVTSGAFTDFKGVIVNKCTGQMLQLASYNDEDDDLIRYAVGGNLYNGSDEKQYYNEHGNFDGFSTKEITTIWVVEMY